MLFITATDTSGILINCPTRYLQVPQMGLIVVVGKVVVVVLVVVEPVVVLAEELLVL